MNVSYAAATQWLFNFVVARSVPVMLVTLGGETGYGWVKRLLPMKSPVPRSSLSQYLLLVWELLLLHVLLRLVLHSRDEG